MRFLDALGSDPELLELASDGDASAEPDDDRERSEKAGMPAGSKHWHRRHDPCVVLRTCESLFKSGSSSSQGLSRI